MTARPRLMMDVYYFSPRMDYSPEFKWRIASLVALALGVGLLIDWARRPR